jgi:hypothetical protein
MAVVVAQTFTTQPVPANTLPALSPCAGERVWVACVRVSVPLSVCVCNHLRLCLFALAAACLQRVH